MCSTTRLTVRPRPYTKNDQPGSSQSPAGPHGDHKCDTPTSLAESMYSAIESLVPDAAFGIFTGDIVDHAVWNTTRPYNELQSMSPNGPWHGRSPKLKQYLRRIGKWPAHLAWC